MKKVHGYEELLNLNQPRMEERGGIGNDLTPLW